MRSSLLVIDHRLGGPPILQGRQVAIKILSVEKFQTPAMKEEVKLEIKILKLCMHPHIIRLYEVIETPAEVYVVIEYSPGGELFDYIVERGRLHEDEARRYFQQIVAGVEYCHQHSVAHRDLKPENLLFDEHRNIKIADFGLSNCMRDGWFLKTSCGSPNYASPEIISGKLYAGNEVDVWSCGVILYALLCGTLPFDEENFQRLFQKIKRGLYLQPSYLSNSSKDLIARMLQTDPVERISIAEIRRHPWFLKDIPEYLFTSSADPRSELEAIDERALRDAVRLCGYSRSQICNAIRKGRRNHVTAGYHLEKDAHDKLERLAMRRNLHQEVGWGISRPDDSNDAGEGSNASPFDGIGQQFAFDEDHDILTSGETSARNAGAPASSSAAASHEVIIQPGLEPTMMVTPSHSTQPVSLGSPHAHGTEQPLGSAEEQEGDVSMLGGVATTLLAHGHHIRPHRVTVRGTPTRNTRVRMLDFAPPPPSHQAPMRHWTTGARAPRTHPAELMTRVYQTLHRLNWRWKTPSEKAFEVRVLVDGPAFARPVRLCLQLFKTLSSYTLDIHRIDGDMLPYFAVCSEFIRELDF
jgi:serine/threonine protein kinase